MKASVLVAALSAFALAATPAFAEKAGWYVGGGGGWSQPEDMNSSDSALSFHSSEGGGFAVLGFGGYNFGGMFRAEGELGYRHADIRSLSIGNDGGLGARLGTGSLTGASTDPTGNISALSAMLNGIFDLLPARRFTPYLGAGIGVARLSLSNFAVGGTTVTDGTDTQFAYQGIAGVSFALTPRIALALDYRYFATTDPSFRDSSGVPFRTQYHTHNALLTLTYRFGAPAAPAEAIPAVAPAPVPAPPVAPALPPAAAAPRDFLVFFDFDEATLTPTGAEIVRRAAEMFRTVGAARLDLTGYTDRAGSAAYNLALSRRRADAVRAYLLQLGVPEAAITETARGEENPRVPTAAGVREPQNRRVEIVLP